MPRFLSKLIACLVIWQSIGFAVAQEAPIFLKVEAEQENYFAGQEVLLRVVVYAESNFLDEKLVQIFRQPVDIPMQVSWSWPEQSSVPGNAESLSEGADHRRFPVDADQDEHRSLVQNGRVAKARVLSEQKRNGKNYARFELQHRFWANQAGELKLSPVTLRYAYGSRFREDLLQGRVAEDRQEGEWKSPPLKVKIQALPIPSENSVFTGAVGRFVIETALTDSISQHYSLQLTLRGNGNLESVRAPIWPETSKFHCLGIVEVPSEAAPGARSFLYDLVPLEGGLNELPSLEFCYFDPVAPAAYRTVYSNSIPLAQSTAGPSPDEGASHSTADVSPEQAAQIPISSESGWLLSFLLLFPWLVVLLLIAKVLPKSARPDWLQRMIDRRTPGEGALASHSDLNPHQGDFDSLTLLLASQLKLSPSAVICPDLQQRLSNAGINSSLAARTADLHHKLIASRYGGPDIDEKLSHHLPLLEELQAAFSGLHQNATRSTSQPSP